MVQKSILGGICIENTKNTPWTRSLDLQVYGAVVIRDAADPALIAQVEAELEAAGAWSPNREDRAPGVCPFDGTRWTHFAV